MKRYFGTDGIRGKALEKLNSNVAFKLGQAIAKSLKPMEVVIGEDTRQSSSLLAYGVAYGLALAGVNVYMAGIVSTPMIALYSKETHKIGVMITASHNPYTDNGIKVFKNGYKMLDDEELELEKYIDEDELLVSNSFGNILFTDEVRKLYIDKVNSLNLPAFNQSIIYDSANGANYKISNEIMSHYAKNSLQIGNTPDGFNINLNVGSTYIDTISLKVKEHHAQIGLSYDGDGDRLLVVDHSGKLFDGDLIIYIIAKYLKKKGQLKKDTVVLTRMSNLGVINALKGLGINVILTDVGDKYVSDELVKNGYSLGGENSGHLILNDYLPSGDGLFASLFLLKVLEEMNETLESATKEIYMYPQVLHNIRNVDKNVLNHPTIINLINDIKEKLGDDSKFFVRPSGTEDLIRVTISHRDETVLKHYLSVVIDEIKRLGEIKK